MKYMELVLSLLLIGVYKYANGNKYEGEWKLNKKNGKGTAEI